MRIRCFFGCALILLPPSTSAHDQGVPQLVYGTYLGGRYKTLPLLSPWIGLETLMWRANAVS